MGKYNFNYDRIKTLEAQNAQLNTENANLKTNVEGLTKAMEALTKEVLELKQGTHVKKKHYGFSSYISEEAEKVLFSKTADNSGKLITADRAAVHSNVTTFYSNIVRAIAPIARTKNGTRGFLQAKAISDMTETEANAIGEAIQKCCEICLETKKKLEEIK